MRVPTVRVQSATLLAAALALATVPLAPGLAAQSATKPRLSEEIRTVLEKDGPEAADRRFKEIFPEHKDEWEVDFEGLAKLGMEVMQSGDMAAGQTVLGMIAVVQQDLLTSSGMTIPAEAEQPGKVATTNNSATSNKSVTGSNSATANAAGAVATVSERAQGRGPDLGPARDDLERFIGEYGDDPLRRLFVTVSCDGHLVSGATWGDASNWWLRSVSDSDFTYSDQFTSVEMSFAVGPDGQATTMTHNQLDLLPATLERHELREGWEECVVPPWG